MNNFQRSFESFNNFIACICRLVFLVCITAFFASILYFIVWSFVNIDQHNTIEILKGVLDEN